MVDVEVEVSPGSLMRGSSSHSLQPCHPPKGELSSFARNTCKHTCPQDVVMI